MLLYAGIDQIEGTPHTLVDLCVMFLKASAEEKAATDRIRGRFHRGDLLPPGLLHGCELWFLELFDGDRLDPRFGDRLAAQLMSELTGVGGGWRGRAGGYQGGTRNVAHD